MLKTLPLGVALVLLLAACGAEAEEPAAPEPPAPALYEANAMVLEAGDAGPMLCLGAVAESYPPQCGDIPLTGWDWDAVEGEERAAGTVWGSYRVVGEYDGETFAVAEAGPYEPEQAGPGVPDFTTPCPEPEGGWAVVDPSRAGEEDFAAAAAYAESQPDRVAVWVDYPGDPSPEEVDQAGAEGRPVLQILNATFTGDVARHEEELRALWGGPLCVAESESRSAAELEGIRAEAEAAVEGELGLRMLWSSGPGVEPAIEIGVVADPGGEAQAALDERYGAGTVRLFPALRPVG
jgi:hypothetical protein